MLGQRLVGGSQAVAQGVSLMIGFGWGTSLGRIVRGSLTNTNCHYPLEVQIDLNITFWIASLDRVSLRLRLVLPCRQYAVCARVHLRYNF